MGSVTPEEPAAGRLADGDDGRMRELSVGRDGVEALAKLLGATDQAHAVLPAHLRLDRARGREYADARLAEHLQERAVVELAGDSRPQAGIREPALEGPTEGGAVARQEKRGAVERARETPPVGGGYPGRGEEGDATLPEGVVKDADLDGWAGLGVLEDDVKIMGCQFRQ